MKKFLKNYWFILCMLIGIVAGCLVGAFAPAFGGKIKFLGTLFINMMFCVVVPLVFVSIAGSIANMKSMKRAGKIMGTTVATFVITGAIAAVIMFALMKIFPPVLVPWNDIPSEEIGEYASISDMIVNFFTASDFVGLLTRKAMLPLIVGISYEFNRWAGRHDGPITRILVAPGLWLQNFTTFEPDDSMMEVGIKALELVLPEKQGEDAW